MARVELLNGTTHAELRLADVPARTRWQGFVELVIAEFAPAAAFYPLFFAKNGDTGRFATGMLHGFKAGEPIPDETTASSIAYLPAALKRQGFFAAGEAIAVDEEHPRIVGRQGQALFEADGQPSSALREVQQAIGLLKAGQAPTADFTNAMLEHELVEPIDVSLQFDDGERFSLEGLYTVGLDRLNALSDSAVLALFRADQLRLAFCMAGSLQRLSALAQERNRALA